jgi:hypothetical protein
MICFVGQPALFAIRVADSELGKWTTNHAQARHESRIKDSQPEFLASSQKSTACTASDKKSLSAYPRPSKQCLSRSINDFRVGHYASSQLTSLGGRRGVTGPSVPLFATARKRELFLHLSGGTSQ